MRTFLYTANDERGRPITKQVRAKDRQEALEQLRDRGYTHIRLRDVTAATYADASATLITPGVPDDDLDDVEVPPLASLVGPPPPDGDGPLLAPVEMTAPPVMRPLQLPASDRPPWAFPETINFLRRLPTSTDGESARLPRQ